MNISNSKRPAILAGLVLIAAMIACCCLWISRTPSVSAADQPVVKSTISHESGFSRSSLPFAEKTRAFLPGAYDNEARPSFDHSNADPQPAASAEVDATQPGNQIRFDGKRISVAETLPTTQGSGHELAIDIAPDEDAEAAVPAPENGIAPDEALFRAKWGWAITDQVKNAALVEPDSPGR